MSIRELAGFIKHWKPNDWTGLNNKLLEVEITSKKSLGVVVLGAMLIRLVEGLCSAVSVTGMAVEGNLPLCSLDPQEE